MLKLVKLIYLSDREHLKKFGFPILNDRLVSMPQGPVNSLSLDLINGNVECAEWDDIISDRDNYCVGHKERVGESSFDELSEAEIDSLERVWKEFGAMNKWEIRDWTHDNCPEWEDPKGGASDIPYERVLKYLEHKNASELSADIESERAIERAFASVR